MPNSDSGTNSFRGDQSKTETRCRAQGYKAYTGKDALSYNIALTAVRKALQETGIMDGKTYSFVRINHGIRQIVVSTTDGCTLEQACKAADAYKSIGLEHVQIIEQVKSYKRYHV